VHHLGVQNMQSKSTHLRNTMLRTHYVSPHFELGIQGHC